MHTLIARMWAEILSGRTIFELDYPSKAIAMRAQLNRFRKRLENKIDPMTGVSMAQRHYEYSLLVRGSCIVVEPAVPEALLDELFPQRQSHQSAMAQLNTTQPVLRERKAEDFLTADYSDLDPATRAMMEKAQAEAREAEGLPPLVPGSRIIRSPSAEPPPEWTGPLRSPLKVELSPEELEKIREKVRKVREEESPVVIHKDSTEKS